jgi:hypothetical protein
VSVASRVEGLELDSVNLQPCIRCGDPYAGPRMQGCCGGRWGWACLEYGVMRLPPLVVVLDKKVWACGEGTRGDLRSQLRYHGD